MSDGKNIEIKIAATGGDQAAAEVKKVQSATEESSLYVQKSNGAWVKHGETVEEAADRAIAALKPQTAAVKDLDEETQKVSTTSRSARLKEVAVATGAIGLAAGAAAKTFQQVREALESIDTKQLRAVDAAMAANIESAKTWALALEDPIGALLKLTTGETVQSAFSGLNDQLARNAKTTSEAVDRIIEKGTKQAADIKTLTDAIVAANEILDARDKADSAERDNADAAAVRGGADEEDVAARRAQDQAQKEIDRINRGLDPQIAKVNGMNESLRQRRSDVSDLIRREGTTPDQQAAAQAALKKAEEEFQAEKTAFENAKIKAEQERREVRAVATGQVAEFGAKKTARISEASSRREDAGFEARQNFQDFQDYRRKGQQRDDLEGREESLDNSARDASGKFTTLGGRAGGKLGSSLQGIGNKLADGTNQAEIDKLSAEFAAATQGMGSATIVALKAMLDAQKKQAAEIEQLRKKLKIQ